ncbi:MAG TPA: alpha/beta fold hydrolase [Solirubrobacteraceae bacterium]|nr:alpha/beta fold hydrolase [Solirubrobacteraceae bacterium]
MPRALLALVAAFVVLVAPASADVRKGPKGAAFYKPPKHLHGKHGGLIWARKQTGSDALKGARRNTLLLYRSKGLSSSLTAVSGSLSIPKGKPPKGGWPVITYAHGTTGSADACAPTRGYDADKLVSYAYPLLKRWLKAGYAVVRTDYDGLGTPGVHGYLVGRSEGRSVLDAVRAARAYDHRLSKRFIIAGHSQGGHAALFAAAMAPQWVPDLRLRGTVAFAPASHLAAQFPIALQSSNPGGGLGAIIALGLRGVDTADSALGIPSLLTPRALALYDQTKTRCYDALSKSDSFGGVPLDQYVKSGADLQPALTVVGESDPEHLRPRTPIRIEQGTADGTVFEVFTKQLADEYTDNGVKVDYLTYDGVTHGGIVNSAAGDATNWIRKRLK